MKKRFSKDTMLSHIAKKMQLLEEKWGFDPNNGNSQVVDSEFNRVMAFGEYTALDYLYDQIAYGFVGNE
jgi:hypothetical protein